MGFDKSRANDSEYMKWAMKEYRYCVQFLVEDLKNNPDFILDMLRMEDFNLNFALIKALGEKLNTNIDFLVSCAEILRDKGVLRKDNFRELEKVLPSDFIKDNKEFYNKMQEIGVTNKENIHTNFRIRYRE